MEAQVISSTSSFEVAVEAATPAQRQPSERACLWAGVVTLLLLVGLTAILNRFPPLSDKRDMSARVIYPQSPEWYVAYANGGLDEFTIFDNLHGASNALKRADVLFLGNSHAVFGLSRDALAPYFEKRGLTYYNMAFGYNETSVLPQAIIRKFDLHPKWVVIVADPFFSDAGSSLADKVMSGTKFDGYKFALETNISLAVKHELHQALPYIPNMATKESANWIQFRSYRDGTVYVASYMGNPNAKRPKSLMDNWDIQKSLPAAQEFKAEMDRRGTRIILTCIPPFVPCPAEQLGHALHVPTVEPAPDGLETLDGAHLDKASATAYTQRLLQGIDGILSH